jgi:hypothetical protein
VTRLRSEAIDDFTVIGAASGRTAVAIAEQCEVNERTIRRRLTRPDIQRRVLIARGELLARVRGQVVDLMSEGCRTLTDVMVTGNDEKTRIAAARVVLSTGASLAPDDDLTAMFLQLQEQLASLKEIVAELLPEP